MQIIQPWNWLFDVSPSRGRLGDLEINSTSRFCNVHLSHDKDFLVGICLYLAHVQVALRAAMFELLGTVTLRVAAQKLLIFQCLKLNPTGVATCWISPLIHAY